MRSASTLIRTNVMNQAFYGSFRGLHLLDSSIPGATCEKIVLQTVVAELVRVFHTRLHFGTLDIGDSRVNAVESETKLLKIVTSVGTQSAGLGILSFVEPVLPEFEQ